jgi:hypothetical protein
MSRVNVSEATGPVLDWMVGYARSIEATDCKPILARDLTDAALRNGTVSPSTDWSQGGPIIEQEMRNHGFDVWRTEGMKECAASYARGVPSDYVFGPTPLIAAMRCYVASKLGDEVEIPEGLNHG